MSLGAAARGRFDALAPNLRGAFWVVLAAALFVVMGTLTKLLADRFESAQMGFFRVAFGLVAVLPFVVRMGPRQLVTGRLWLHLLRGLGGGLAVLCGFYAIMHLSFADAVSISYARMLFVIPLAVLFLGEKVRVRRWTATAVGLVGVLIMLRPHGEIQFATWVALAGALLVAGVSIVVKRLAETERPETLLFYFGVTSTLVTLLPALAVWRQPTGWELALLLAIGGSGSAAQYCMIQGYKAGEATAVIPFDYSRLIFAAAVGVVLFAEYPDLWTILGAAVIAASTLYIALREARLKLRPPTS
jgi:drug/metabolite transporter (DMT)-like permease